MHRQTIATLLVVLAFTVSADDAPLVFKPGDASLQHWLLDDAPPFPSDNEPTAERIELGKKLFFDPRVSGDGSTSCATCHNPGLGWSDGLPTSMGFRNKPLKRASPTVVNTAYNSIQMWDGSRRSLEHQVMGPIESSVEMNGDVVSLFQWLNLSPGYRALFAQAYPGETIDEYSFSKAVASFERTVVSNNSAFDRWVKGDTEAMSAQQVSGFKLFNGKANCAACHSAPNFTDDGFHNIGLASWGDKDPDMGRYAIKPIRILKGAFKTPTVRDIERTAPYFHDGSASTLMEVVEHYDIGGAIREGISPNMKPLNLTQSEKEDLVAFMRALTSPFVSVSLPELPLE